MHTRRQVAHVRPGGHHKASPSEVGYTLIMTALLLLPLMAFTGFAVDVGGWYARGNQLQRAADASALAGAARMPDFSAASAEVTKTAKKNGFVAGGNITITITRLGERKIEVSIKDADVTRAFSSLFMTNKMTITRKAVAEFVLPVPLGSPLNFFGNDPVTPPVAGQPGLWGNIHGTQTDNFKGDRYAAGCRSASSCGAPSNGEYRGFYWYSVDVPAGSGSVSIDVYDAGLFDRGSNEQVETGDRQYGSGNVHTSWNFLYDVNNTLLDYTDAVPASCSAGTGNFEIDGEQDPGLYKNRWATLCQMSSPTPGRYWIKVATSGDGDGANRYAVRANYSGSGKVRLSAFGDMSMFNNQLSVNPNFYLAEVDPIHVGKTFLVSLYDPGEIGVPNAKMEILQPGGATVSSCEVKVFNAPTDTNPATTNTYSPCSIPTTNASSGGLYNGKLLAISIKIPTTYACTNCWWKVRYNLGGATGGTPNDTTTWSASILGDPVHLINE